MLRLWKTRHVVSVCVLAVMFQQQHLIELIREKKIEEALDFAQTHLAERGEENREILSELEHTLALLAFENPELSPFGELLHPSQRQKVGSCLCLVKTVISLALTCFYVIIIYRYYKYVCNISNLL